MADYFAVLNRTLAGFGEPKPELRGKLYERARMTIRRQLDSHTPPLDDAALKAEMSKLEEAIIKVESGFAPPNVPLDKAEPATESAKPADADKPEDAKPPQSDDKKSGEKKAEEPPAQPPEPEMPESAAQPEAKAPLSRREKRAAEKAEAKRKKSESKQKKTETDKADNTEKEKVTTAAKLAVQKTAAKPEQAVPEKTGKAKAPDKVIETPKVTEEPHDDAASALASGPEKESTPDISASEVKSGTEGEVVDPMDEWAREFLNAQEESKPEVAKALAEIQAETEQSKEQPASSKASPDERAASIAAEATAAAATKTKKAAAPASELPAFDASQDKSIVIPPATSVDTDRKKGGILKWLLLALVALLIAVAGYLAINWEDRAEIASSLGLDGLFGGTVEPRPVKTIKIVPDPEPEPEPESPTAAETPVTSEPDAPKSEERLTGDNEILQPATPAPEATTGSDEQPAPETGSEDGAAAQPEAEAGQPLPAAEAGTTPVVAQSAILYEEGGSPNDNSFDTGRVVWSVVEEQGAEGEGNIPAIRARVEVPSRQLVLIMTIKRNTDRALPASHLIELVFAVPDDFSGGSIGEINRFVLKESEQDRGAALIGVPARISDGIFLIALNNLESAQKTNEQLLRNRPWVDIPMQYRTGRRALITLEKGVPGSKVFSDVFEAWDKLDNKP